MMIRKLMLASALVAGTAMAVTSPAAAWDVHHPGGHFSGYRGARGWHGGGRGCCGGGAVAAGVIGGLAAGALVGAAVASRPAPPPPGYYAPPPGYYAPAPGY